MSTLVAKAEATLIVVELGASLGFKNCIFEINSLLVYRLPPNHVKFNSDAACDSFSDVVALAVLVQDPNDKLIHGVRKTKKSLLTLVT